MRPLFPAFILLLAAPAARADDAADAKAIVARGIKAAGNTDDGKSGPITWKDDGILNFGGMKFAYTADWYVLPPDTMRFDLTAEFMGQKVRITHVVNGDKVWDSADGMTREVAGEKKQYSLNAVYLMSVYSLKPLTHDEGFKLATAGEKEVSGKPALGVRVERQGKPTVTLYFDKVSGLLAKAEVKVKDEFQDWKEVLDENYFEDWKDVGGKKVFTKLRVVRDGKPLLESKLSDQKTPDKLDPKLFEKP
ncbi:MAG TPA: hypothetical protein VKE74_31630 [Gemmataceae bacterium]|nr:hypothetical protein [Gemmataceae bacterium]